jgi:hypothetical protein
MTNEPSANGEQAEKVEKVGFLKSVGNPRTWRFAVGEDETRNDKVRLIVIVLCRLIVVIV